MAEFIHPLVFKRGVVLLSVAAGRLTAAKALWKVEHGSTRHSGRGSERWGDLSARRPNDEQ
ncbi:hypothetical protein (plasmid) [Serratia marcescens]|uniref:Uncharacterized protein n=1 Tax=Serratia marcescens TaxID=615 RepID=A0A8X6ENS5_SERMA|nr:hypothetical protein [Serratia marcescens]BCG07194.1 hypothetical protein [Serratia marcescens]BCG07306.1 hypothetical protein [Serratia marcescens]BCT02725.1 hypothetical protein [Serratia marcescens]BCT02816.1 hypothetical protein [Serratia marcescens]